MLSGPVSRSPFRLSPNTAHITREREGTRIRERQKQRFLVEAMKLSARLSIQTCAYCPSAARAHEGLAARCATKSRGAERARGEHARRRRPDRHTRPLVVGQRRCAYG